MAPSVGWIFCEVADVCGILDNRLFVIMRVSLKLEIARGTLAHVTPYLFWASDSLEALR